MKDLLILGAAGHAQEMAQIVERINRVRKTWNLLGYISAKEEEVGLEFDGVTVLGTPAKISNYGGAKLAPVEGWRVDPAIPRDRYATLIDPSTFVSRTAQIGAGCVIYPNCYVGLGARLGDFVFVMANSVINHDNVFGDRVIVTSSVSTAGYVHVEADCYLGQACTIRQYLRIGRNSQIGMGAVVIKDVSPDSVMVGNPARKLKDRPPQPG